MATDLGQPKTTATAKHDAFVQTQLARTEKRIRTLDLTAALLGFAGGTLAFAVGMAVLDRWLTLPEGARQAGVVVYLLAAAGYLTAFVVLPMSRRINPYFAARQLERTLPGAKNSVVNWLDLHGENLAPAIRGAVGQRAAKDLARADLEKAVSGRRAYTAGGIAALCALAFVIALFTLGFGQFFGFLARAFVPFGATGAAPPPTGTRITVVKPADGDAVVADLRPVEVLVRVDGRVPDPKAADALKLQFRYEPSGPYQQRLLEPDDGGRWGVMLQPVDVQDGFWYKVTGGDATTPEYRVRQTPRILDFTALYQFRPYVARANEKRKERKIEALRGTQVDVTVHANRDVKDGWLQFDGANGTTVTHGDRPAGDRHAFTVHLTLDESSQYRICFTSAEGENFVEPQGFPLIAVPDKPPVVTLTSPAEVKDKPGWIAPLPANGLLQPEGSATDDVGVKAMRLNLQVEKGPTLPPQEYRTPKDFQLPHGGNPATVEYKDFIDLAKLRTPADALFTVRPGMVLEYWLTAEDACDYPDPNKPNVGESKHYHVLIVDPLNNDQVQQQARDKAAADKKTEGEKQDKKNADEDQKREEERKQQEQKNQAGDKGDKPNKSGDQSGDPQHQDGNNTNPKPGDQPKPGDNPQEGNNPDKSNQQNPGEQKNNSNPDQGNSPAEKKDLKDTVDEAAKQIRKDTEGKGKPDAQQQPADGKDGGKPPEKPPQSGEAKDAGGPQEKKDASESKGGPQDRPGEKHDEGAAKQEGRPDPMQPQQGEAKPGGDPKAQPDAQPGQSKDGKTESAPQPGETKEGGKPDDQKQAASDKSQPGATGDKTEKAESKEGNPPNMPPNAQPAGQGKDKAAPENKSEAKGPAPDDADKDAAKSKGDGSTPMGDPKQATAKSGGDKPPDHQDMADRKSDGSEGEPQTEEDKQKSADEAFKKLQDDLKSSDPKRREAAEDFTRRYLMNANDPQIRDRAKKTLEDAGLDPNDDKLGTNKPEHPPNEPKGSNEPKEPPAQGKQQGPDKDAPSTGKDNPPDDPPNDPKKGESKGDGKPMNSDPMKEPPPPATAKSGPGDGALHRDATPPSNDGTPPPTTNETPVAQRASTLQLLNFYQAVPKDVLKDAMLDPDKLKALEDAMRNFLAKHPAEGKDDLTGPQHGGPLNNTVGKVSDPNGKSPNDDPNNGGRAQPPPEYRGPYKDFTKLLSPGGK